MCATSSDRIHRIDESDGHASPPSLRSSMPPELAAPQIEIYFSIVQRKALTPNDFPSLEAVAERLSNFERYVESVARPFEWKFTRVELNALIARMRSRYRKSST